MEITFLFLSLPKKIKRNLPQNPLNKTHLCSFIDGQTALKGARTTDFRRIKALSIFSLMGEVYPF